MGEIVALKPARLDENHEFVSDCCRYQEGILTEANMKLKYGFAESVWENLGSNEKLLAAVEEEKIRRIRSGQQKRERAQVLVTAAPDIMSKIMLDDAQSARHRIDSAKALDDFASKGPEAAAAAATDRFVITINLGGDHVEHYNKSISINAEDTDPNDDRPAPQRSLPDKPWDSDDVDSSDVVARPAMRLVKTIEHEIGRLVERSPEEIALEAMLAMEE